MKVSTVSLAKSVIVYIAPAVVMMIAGCDTADHSGVFAILDTSVSFIGDFLRSALAAYLF